MMIRFQIRANCLWVVLLAGCNPGTVEQISNNTCSPTCQTGQHCDTTSLTCVCDNPCIAVGTFCDPAGSGRIGECTRDVATSCFLIGSLVDCTTPGEICVAGAGACAVPDAALQIATTTLPGAQTNTFYSAALAAAGGILPYTWSITIGMLPAGLSLDSSLGVVSGIPTTPTMDDFTVQVTDAVGAQVSKALFIVVTESNSCGNGDLQCVDTILKVCGDNEWMTSQDCANNQQICMELTDTMAECQDPPGQPGQPSGSFCEQLGLDCDECGTSLDYQCDTKTICGYPIDYGNCPTGYHCSENLCISSGTEVCTGVICGEEEYCSNGICLLSVPSHTYFVALWGDDSNPGTFAQPWKSWQKAVLSSQPGDITYIRGGIWRPTSHVVIDTWETWAVGMYVDPRTGIGVNGTAEEPIRYYNYPGEKPILDGSLVDLDEGFNGGIDIEASQYLFFKGLTVRNIFQRSSGSEAFGIGSFDAANLHYENMVVHNIDGRAFQHWGGAWTLWGNEADLESYYPSNFQIDNTSWVNCDAYNLFDRYSSDPGNAADGFLAHGHYGNHHRFDGCRAWNYSDDGFNTFFEAYTTVKDCWAMSTLKYVDQGSWNIEGNGFKLNGVNYLRVLDYQVAGENFVKVVSSIAANCLGRGFINNIDVYESDPNARPSNGLFYNNFAYMNNTGFYDGGENFDGKVRSTVYKNNIAYESTSVDPLYEVGIYYPSIYPHSNNTWVGTGKWDDWPGWDYNLDYNVSNDDFVSLDYYQLTAPRSANGDLPNITFGHLKAESDLIDGGAIISGYHCASPGEHPMEDCAPWNGLASDLGPFETN